MSNIVRQLFYGVKQGGFERVVREWKEETRGKMVAGGDTFSPLLPASIKVAVSRRPAPQGIRGNPFTSVEIRVFSANARHRDASSVTTSAKSTRG